MAKRENGLSSEEKQYKSVISGLAIMANYVSRFSFTPDTYNQYQKFLTESGELERSGKIGDKLKDDLKRVLGKLDEPAKQYKPPADKEPKGLPEETPPHEPPEQTTKEIPQPSQIFTLEDIANAVSEGIRPLVEEISLSPLQKAERNAKNKEAEYKDRIAEAVLARKNDEVERIRSELGAELDSIYAGYGLKRPGSEPEKPKGLLKRWRNWSNEQWGSKKSE